LQVVAHRDQHVHGREVDGRDRLRVEHDGTDARVACICADGLAHRVGVGEEEPALDPQDHDARNGGHIGIPFDVLEWLVRSRLAEHGAAVEAAQHASRPTNPRHQLHTPDRAWPISASASSRCYLVT
jgi:hypothetical protein